MRLIPELGPTANSTTFDQVTQLSNCQARFLAHTKTSRILQAVPNSCNPDFVYQTLRDMTLPSGLANLAGKPLFHAISPMATKEGYLVRYLPQYSNQARAVLAQLSNKFSQHPIDPITPKPPSIAPTLQPLTASTAAPSSLVELDTRIGLRFCTPFCLGSIPRAHQPDASTRQGLRNTTHQPSNYNILHWLTALWQLLQNTAWDRWRYRNGVAHQWRDFHSSPIH